LTDASPNVCLIIATCPEHNRNSEVNTANYPLQSEAEDPINYWGTKPSQVKLKPEHCKDEKGVLKKGITNNGTREGMRVKQFTYAMHWEITGAPKDGKQKKDGTQITGEQKSIEAAGLRERKGGEPTQFKIEEQIENGEICGNCKLVLNSKGKGRGRDWCDGESCKGKNGNNNTGPYSKKMC